MFGKSSSYLGIDIGAGGIKLVELHQQKKRPVLFTYAFTEAPVDVHMIAARSELGVEEMAEKKPTMPLATGQTSEQNKTLTNADEAMEDPNRIERYVAMLKALCKKARTHSKIAVASLPVSGVFHAIVTLPILQKKEETDRVLKAEVQKLLPFRLEDVVLDSQALPNPSPDQKTERVLVNAVPRAVVLFYTTIFKQAGLILDSLEPESIALARSLVGRDAAPTMLIDIGAERTNFFIIEQGIPLTHTSIELGGSTVNDILAKRLGVEVPLAQQIKKDLFLRFIKSPAGDTLNRERFFEIFNPFVAPIIKEIDYTLEMYMRQNQTERPEKIILSGGASFFPYLSDSIAEIFKLKCYLGDPWGRVVYQDGLKPILRTIAPRLSVAIGLALRNMV